MFGPREVFPLSIEIPLRGEMHDGIDAGHGRKERTTVHDVDLTHIIARQQLRGLHIALRGGPSTDSELTGGAEMRYKATADIAVGPGQQHTLGDIASPSPRSDSSDTSSHVTAPSLHRSCLQVAQYRLRCRLPPNTPLHTAVRAHVHQGVAVSDPGEGLVGPVWVADGREANELTLAWGGRD